MTATLDVAAGQVALRLARRGLPRLAAQLAELPAGAAFALLTSLDPGADACLVWSPGQRAPEAIAAPGSTGAALAGCFALIVPRQAADGCELFEDGFATMLTDVTTARLRQALTHGQALALPSTKAGSHGLTVAWID